MKRNLPEVVTTSDEDMLPAPAADVIRILSPLVTDARRTRMDEIAKKRTRSLIPVLEDLLDPHNGGAILRSADAFGCHEVHVIERHHPFVVSNRVTRGTHRWLDLRKHESAATCLDGLRARGYRVFVAAMDGTVDPEALSQTPKAAVVFGNEHRGASDEVRARVDGVYRIPMEGFVESLNVSVASAITLYVASRGRHGDLAEEERDWVRARWLMGSVRDAERIVLEALSAQGRIGPRSGE